VRKKKNLPVLCTSALPSARDLALVKDFFLILKYALLSARSGALGKVAFAECHFWTLGKVHFYFFYFPNQNFCGVFLHYIDLHVPF
jgi:hypothetical protein